MRCARAVCECVCGVDPAYHFDLVIVEVGEAGDGLVQDVRQLLLRELLLHRLEGVDDAPQRPVRAVLHHNLRTHTHTTAHARAHTTAHDRTHHIQTCSSIERTRTAGSVQFDQRQLPGDLRGGPVQQVMQLCGRVPCVRCCARVRVRWCACAVRETRIGRGYRWGERGNVQGFCSFWGGAASAALPLGCWSPGRPLRTNAASTSTTQVTFHAHSRHRTHAFQTPHAHIPHTRHTQHIPAQRCVPRRGPPVASGTRGSRR